MKMNYTQKKQIKIFLDYLCKINSGIMEIQNQNSLTEVLGLCQETALKIGNTIESYEQYPEYIIRYLEGYCEFIYGLSMAESDIARKRKIIAEIEVILSKIDYAIENEIQERPIEVVFLPYNATMWDCFHSIYKEAVKDERFKVYVVPIPYYNLDQGRNITAEYYEADKIAEYAQVTNYKDYDITQRKPDIIFIHNPYDEYNMVTQVPKKFFSSELVKYTPHLVYIPYYVSKKLTSESMLSTPGVRNAWLSVVQSEEMRQQYIDGGIAPENVVALGSPKFDRVVQAEREYQEIPEEWDILKGKKVFFWNTHLHGLMNDVNRFLDKIEEIIHIFNVKEGIALLWRPHPLSIETLQTFQPGVVSRYLDIVEKFKKCKNFVYDDTPELERTIAVSDAYIGEEQSSVSQLYEITGKPMYYINNEMQKISVEERQIRSCSAEIVDRKIYMYSWEYNVIGTCSLETGEVMLERGSKYNDLYVAGMYPQSIKCGQYIYFIPQYGDMILKYDTQTLTKSYIKGCIEENYFKPIQYEEKIYLMPLYCTDEFPCLDTKTDEVFYIKTHYKEQIGNLDGIGKIPLFVGAVIAEGCIWRAFQAGPYIQKFHIEERVFEYIELDEIDVRLRTLAYDGECFWIIMQSGTQIIKWNPHTGLVTTVNPKGNNMERVYSDIFYFNQYIWVLPYTGCMLTKIHVDTLEKTMIDCCECKGFCTDAEDCEIFIEGNYRILGQDIYFFPYKSNGIVRVNADSNKLSYISTKYNFRKVSQSLGISQVYHESICRLDDFITNTNMERVNRTSRKMESAGKAIWNYIVDRVI